MIIIRIVGLANGQLTEAAGKYVQSYTPHGYGGAGDLIVTSHRDRAKRYIDTEEALRDWKATSRSHPWRNDGKPNRPMTAFTVELENA